jgi:glycosyltransferase involved in cell wall biosynthesis
VETIRRLRATQFQAADAIICPSEFTRKDLHEFYNVPGSKTFVVHHGVSRLGGALDSESPSVIDCPFLLYVGSRAPYKNFSGLLQGFAVSGLKKEFQVVAVGGGATTAAEVALLQELDLIGSVRFIPGASDRLLAALYADARLLVCPSFYEGFGFPPLEAMSLGCPSLVARTSCLPEICRNAAFYFEVDSLECLVSSLRMACFDESQRASKIQEGKELSISYTWDRCATNVLKIYEQ